MNTQSIRILTAAALGLVACGTPSKDDAGGDGTSDDGARDESSTSARDPFDPPEHFPQPVSESLSATAGECSVTGGLDSTSAGSSSGGDDPCAPLQACLDILDTADEQCAAYGECTMLFHPPGVSCEPLCGGEPCADACIVAEDCVSQYQCIFGCNEDPCNIDCLWQCWNLGGGDCNGSICTIDLACDVCP